MPTSEAPLVPISAKFMSTNTGLQVLPLAILPGLLCDSRMYGAQLAAFPQAVVIDGFYGGARSLEAMAEIALKQLPGRFALVGHSMGGRIALEIMRREPERAAALVLADTGVHPVQPGEADKRLALRDIGRSQGIAALVDAWLPPMIAPDRRCDAALVEPLTAMCVAAGLATYEAQIEALLSRPDAADVLPAIACPTLVITGAQDSWASPAQHEAIAAAIPGAELVVVPGAGHMLPTEDPAAFNAAVAALLEQADRGQS